MAKKSKQPPVVAAEDGGGGTSGAGTVTRKAARRPTQPPVLVELSRDHIGGIEEVTQLGPHTIVGVDGTSVDFGDSQAEIDALRMVPASLMTRYREARAKLALIHDELDHAPRPRLGFQLDAFEGRNGQA